MTQEIPSLRTEYSDTYQTTQGIYEAKVFSGPVNYQAADASWQPIDDSLTASGSGYMNKADSYRATLPGSLGSAPVQMSIAGHSISSRLHGASASARASVSGHTATYRDVLPGVDASYDTVPGAVKESLSLSDASAASPITFNIQLSSGLHAVEHEGVILLQDALGRTEIGMPKPFMLDAKVTDRAHPELPSDFGPVEVSTKQTNGGIAVTYTPDRSWLRAPGRTFPVRVDPSYVAPSETADCPVFQSAPTTSYCSDPPYAYVGYDAKGNQTNTFMNFQGVQSALAGDSQVLGAQVVINVPASTTNNGYSVYPMSNHQFTSLATWQTWDGSDPWMTPGGDHESGVQATGTVPSHAWGGAAEQVSFNITALTQSWLDGSRPISSLMITPNTSTGNYFAIDDAASGSGPHISIWYLPRMGAPSGATIEKTQLTDRMALGVNVANGNLLLNNTDLNLAGTGLNETVSRVWNNLSPDNYAGAFGGAGWTNGLASLHQITSDAMYVVGPDGTLMVWDADPNNPGSWIATGGVDATLTQSITPNPPCRSGSSFCWQVTFRSGERWEFAPLVAGQYVFGAHVDQNGNQINYTYSNQTGKVSQVSDTHGHTVAYSYGSNGYISGIVDNAGARSMTYSQNGSRQLIGYKDAAGNTTTYGYDSGGDLSQITDPAGEVTKLAYDSSYRVTSVTRVTNNSNGAGDTTTYSYGPPSNCGADPDGGHAYGETTETDPNGNQTIYCYDTHDRVFQTIDAYGYRTTTGHNLDDEVTTDTQPTGGQYTGGTTTTCYDTTPQQCNSPVQNPCERATAQIAPLALSTSQAPATTQSGYPSSCSTYDPPTDFEPSSGTDPQGNTISYSYDPDGNLSQITDQLASQNTITIHHNLSNQCSSGTCYGLIDYTTSADGARTNYGYDSSGNLTSVSPPSPLGQISYGHDAVSRLTSATDGNGKATAYQYDAMDRVTKETYADGATTTYTYDADGNLLKVVDSQTGTSSFTYDLKDRLTSESSPGVNNSYGYDGADNLTSVADAGGTVTYGYDHDNRLTSVQEPGVSSPIGFAYDVDSRRICTTYPNGVAVQTLLDTSGNILGIKAANGSGAACNPNSLTGTPNGNVFASYVYTYNLGTTDTGLRQTLQINGGSPYTFNYDALNRLQSVANQGLTHYPLNYTYDGDGNLLSKTSVNGTSNNYTYNAADQITTTGYGYDQAGNMLNRPDAGGTTGLGYNVRNQTTSINPDGAGAQTLGYLGNGQKEPTQIGNAPQGGSAPALENDLLGISSQASAAQQGQQPSVTYYTRDTGGTLLGERTPNGRYYYVEDANGSVVAITDQSGTVANTYTYDPWGQTTSTTTCSSPCTPASNNFGFDSGFQSQAGLYHFGQRYYDPGSGSWTQEDPTTHLTDPRQADLYEFAGDDPVNIVDPTGEFGWGSCVAKCVSAYAAFLTYLLVTCGECLRHHDVHHCFECVTAQASWQDATELFWRCIEYCNRYGRGKPSSARLAEDTEFRDGGRSPVPPPGYPSYPGCGTA